MNPRLSEDVERFVATHPAGAVQIEGPTGVVYWLMTEEALEIREKVQVGIDQADSGECTPWNVEEILTEGRKRQAQDKNSDT